MMKQNGTKSMTKKRNSKVGILLEKAYEKLPDYLAQKAKYREAMNIGSSVQRRKILKNKHG